MLQNARYVDETPEIPRDTPKTVKSENIVAYAAKDLKQNLFWQPQDVGVLWLGIKDWLEIVANSRMIKNRDVTSRGGDETSLVYVVHCEAGVSRETKL